MKKVLLSIAVLLAGTVAFSYDFTIKATPSILLPFLSSGEQKYASAGYGTFLDADITLFDFLNLGPEFGFYVLPKCYKKCANRRFVSQLCRTFFPFARGWHRC